MKRTRIKDALNAKEVIKPIQVKGWVRTKRDAKGFSFIELNDGSCLKNIQIIIDDTISSYHRVGKVKTGMAIEVTGELVESPGKGQKWELRAGEICIISTDDHDNYPLQKKRHSDEFLRTIAHLRPRTNKYGSLFRIRSESSYAVHKYFHDRDFYYLHSPIITGSDCEGAGELFRVTTLLKGSEREKDSNDASSKDFFGKDANLTVSGQLEAELFACALGNIYTFGPTFRAENSNTPRHVAEFWMVEPEVAFADLEDNMDLAEDLVKNLVDHILNKCDSDLELFSRFVDKKLISTLQLVKDSTYERLAYRNAIEILEKSGKKFEFDVFFGADLQTEHERFLCEEYFKKPVIIYNYPKVIKPFYMRLNDDGETVAAMDLLVPRIGELIGGSQREERLGILKKRMEESDLNKEVYWWYLDIRRYGSVPHSGFGMGFERFLMMITGVRNIRDVIPFPRTPKNLEF